ncbi:MULTISPECIES: type B DNA-directed DNA polymerase [Halorussus]|uniref:type B DNA-directed DNA polymerase n=1 Tax=Halorussus TaxID=1070314 RepID=UPI000E20E765|nr:MULTISPECIES: type B DNA-directed DNA polymerase [Halorussus]NHN58683.1 type B DNA-directed DNA polymerase [Halorussus sp. JP-T4]
MAFKIDVTDEAVVEWSRTPDGGLRTRRTTDYRPTMYVSGPDGPLADLRAALDDDPKVARTESEDWYTRLDAARRDAANGRTKSDDSDERETVVRVDLGRPSEVSTLAREIRGVHERGAYPPGTFRLFNVDLSPQFRYCVETGTDPATPESVDLSTLSLRIDRKRLADGDLSKLEIDGEPLRATPDVLLEILDGRLAETDPDVLIVNRGELVPLLYEAAAECGRENFELGRTREGRSGHRKLAGESTYESYGRVGHSPARYDLPGRALVDTSNSFLWGHGGLDGLRYLTRRSGKPLQEVGWASIGNVLTAVQIREALDRGVLIPWNKWRPESFKDVSTLHAADRGGFTFAPEVGFHEGVREVDFASLYPRIICEYNVSPDTVLCDCHADRADVPELGYNVCDETGFLVDVLEPLLDDRAAMKETIRASERAGGDADDDPTPDEAARARRVSSVIKWILVSCFGYQGYRNAKFGRIECHEAINAVARDVLLRAKETFEAGGWEVVHGIVDSLWVVPADDRESADLSTLTGRVSDEVDIPLEHEATYDWLCFVPRRDSRAGALNRYFGKVAPEADCGDGAGEGDGKAGDGANGDGDADPEYKLRGIEARQRSTPAFVERVQRDLLDALDRHREPAPVCDVLKRRLRDLRAGEVAPDDLLITRRASKRRESYDRRTRTVAALTRAEDAGLDPQPGQSLDFLVVDDDASRERERVRLDFEVDGTEEYDAEFYADRLLRAAESVLAPLGWDETRIRRYLRDVEEIRLSAFGG